jgi:hypothetical protein
LGLALGLWRVYKRLMQYRGLRAIAKRMGWTHPYQVVRKAMQSDFPAYLERGRGTAIHWVCSDDLIHWWEREQAKRTKASYRAGKRRDDRFRQRDGESPAYAA